MRLSIVEPRLTPECCAVVTVNISRRELLAVLPLVAAGLGVANLSNQAEHKGIETLPFQVGSLGFHCFRTPALAISTHGTNLAFCYGRLANDGDHDIVLRPSSDGGRSVGLLQVLATTG